MRAISAGGRTRGRRPTDVGPVMERNPEIRTGHGPRAGISERFSDGLHTIHPNPKRQRGARPRNPRLRFLMLRGWRHASREVRRSDT